MDVWYILLFYVTAFKFVFGSMILIDHYDWYINKWKTAKLLGYIWMTLFTLFFLPEVIFSSFVELIFRFVSYAIKNSFKK